MANKKAKQVKKKQPASPVSPTANGLALGKDEEMLPPTSPSPQTQSDPSPSQSPPEPSPESTPEPTQEDLAARAEKVKEQGNTAFKAKRYGEAIDLYTSAIQLNPSEPSYLTNRAASHMAIKHFRPALEDCQLAAALPHPSNPSVKTLTRLARCHLALGSPTPALSTLRTALALDPANSPALHLQSQILELESHLRNFDAAKQRREWGMARLALDKCLQGIEGEGGEIPTEWRLWRVELELARGSWEAANMAANDALRLNQNSPDVLALRGLVLFLSGKLPQALQHAQSALRLDPGHEPAQRLRKRVKDVERLKDEGNAAFKAGRFADAVESYTEAIDRIGENEEEGKGGQIRATLLSNRATTLLKLDRHTEALADTTTSLTLLPTSFKALRTRARIYLALEDFPASISDFKSAIQHAQSDGAASDADVRALQTELKKAEAALKRSKTKDYYKILGVPRDCGEAEIKKGYRRESLKHHPDKGGDEEKFKLVVEANAVLSDPQRRERYDMGEDEDGSSGGGPGGMGGMSPMDMAELFAQFHGSGGGGFSSFGGGQGRSHSHGFPF